MTRGDQLRQVVSVSVDVSSVSAMVQIAIMLVRGKKTSGATSKITNKSDAVQWSTCCRTPLNIRASTGVIGRGA